MAMQKKNYEGKDLWVCDVCNFDTFDKKEADVHAQEHKDEKAGDK